MSPFLLFLLLHLLLLSLVFFLLLQIMASFCLFPISFEHYVYIFGVASAVFNDWRRTRILSSSSSSSSSRSSLCYCYYLEGRGDCGWTSHDSCPDHRSINRSVLYTASRACCTDSPRSSCCKPISLTYIRPIDSIISRNWASRLKPSTNTSTTRIFLFKVLAYSNI